MLTEGFDKNDKGSIIKYVLKSFLKAGVNPNTTYTIKNEGTSKVTTVSVLKNANPKILFLFLIFGASLKDVDLEVIKENNNFQKCLTTFEEIRAMPYIGRSENSLKPSQHKCLVQAGILRYKKAKWAMAMPNWALNMS